MIEKTLTQYNIFFEENNEFFENIVEKINIKSKLLIKENIKKKYIGKKNENYKFISINENYYTSDDILNKIFKEISINKECNKFFVFKEKNYKLDIKNLINFFTNRMAKEYYYSKNKKQLKFIKKIQYTKQIGIKFNCNFLLINGLFLNENDEEVSIYYIMLFLK